MSTYIHHIAGRLRTRYPQLKNQPALAKAVESALRRISGVVSVEANTVTGSLLIHYDATSAERDALLDALHRTKRQFGLTATLQAPMSARGSAATVADTLGDKLLGMAVEKCIERAAVALFAALI